MALAGLSFEAGLKLLDDIRKQLDLPVSNPALGRDSFSLVVAFGRCKFHLSPGSVGLILQATIGGVASDFRVSLLQDRVFRFFVSSKPVGLFINRMGSFECELYKLYFHLWGNGGPNWRHEFNLFRAEEEASWSNVHRKKSFADAVRSPPVTGANAVPMGRLSALKRIRPHDPSPRMTGHAPPRRQSAERRMFNPGHSTSSGFQNLNSCTRCLSSDHHRSRCDRPIRCRACFGWGHVVQNCMAWTNQQREHEQAKGDFFRHKNLKDFNGKDIIQVDVSGWFSSPNGPSASQPPPLRPAVQFTVPWNLPLGREGEESADALDPLHWSLAANQSPPLSHFASPAAVPFPSFQQENPSSLLSQEHLATLTSSPAQSQLPPPPPPPPLPLQSAMAFQRSDPQPFVPRNFRWMEVENRVPAVRAVASSRPAKMNEDLAIVHFHYDEIAGNEILFPAVDDVLREFFTDHRIHFLDIQPTTLGQALVRFAHRMDRDNLIALGQIPFRDVSISFSEHNKGRNWRRAYFNTECWLMLLDFPTDYWEDKYVQNALASFGKLLHCRYDKGHLVRLILKARVIDLQSVPQFIVFSETQGLESESWTVQCEVLQSRLLGDGPEDEAPFPVDPFPVGAPFDFFGLGQPGAGPNQNLDDPVEENAEQFQIQALQAQAGIHEQANDNEGWALWPEIPEQQVNPVIILILEPEQEEEVVIDLNLPGQQADDDPMEVVVNPPHPVVHTPPQEDFLELNDFADAQNVVIPVNIADAQNAEIPDDDQIVEEAVNPQINQHGLQMDLNLLADEQALLELADQDMQQLQEDNLEAQVNHLPIDDLALQHFQAADEVVHDLNNGVHIDDIDLDALVGPGEPGFPAANHFQFGNLGIHQALEGIHQALEGGQGPNQQLQNVVQDPELFNDQDNHMNVGIALIRGQDADPVWVERARTAETIRLWANFFATGTQSSLHIHMPAQWANFFTVMLLSPDFFSWAKDFLASKAVSLLSNEAGFIDFFIPQKCPKHILCSSHSDSNTDVGRKDGKEVDFNPRLLEELAPKPLETAPTDVKGKKAIPVVDTGLRRSPRIKQVSAGFKRDGCPDKRCTTCTPDPPILSTQVIRKLGTHFLQLDEEDLSDEALHVKKESSGPIGTKKGSQSRKRKNNEADPGKKNSNNNEEKN